MVMLAVEIKIGFRKKQKREGMAADIRQTENAKSPAIGGAFSAQVTGT
jgi:hypothetical protein